MSLTRKCAQECGQQYGLVTYDLDVAQRAVKIQVTESPKSDDVFVMFGAFRLQMCLFRAIGKIIKESGMTEMLVEAGVLASGSLNGFLEYKNFNQCKRLHPEFDNKEARDQLCSNPTFVRFFDDYSQYSQSVMDGTLWPDITVRSTCSTYRE